jgi:acyl carrier protein
MNMPTVEEVIKIINSCSSGTPLTESDADKNLFELGIDSIDLISAVVKLEETYKIEFPDEKLIASELDSVSKIISIINESSGESRL